MGAIGFISVHGDPIMNAASFADEFAATDGDAPAQAALLAKFFGGLAAGAKQAHVRIGVDAWADVYASGTLTLTCVTAAPTLATQFRKLTDLDTTVRNLIACINVHEALRSIVLATYTSTGVITLTSLQPGATGNAYTLVGSTGIVASAATFTDVGVEYAATTATFVYATLADGDVNTIGAAALAAETGTVDTENKYKKETALATTIANFAACVNAHSKLKGIVTATVTGTGVVTITSCLPGRVGNMITTTQTTGTGVTWADAHLAGATSTQQQANRNFVFGRAA